MLRGHPWVFSGAISAAEGGPASSGVAEVYAHDGRWLARGLYHPQAALALRLYTWDESQPLDAAFFAGRLDAALALRERLFGAGGVDDRTDSYRLVFSEADGISGLIVDRYADVLAVQVGAKGLLPFFEGMLEHLAARTGIRSVHLAVDEDSVSREHLEPTLLRTSLAPAANRVRIRESGFAFDVDLESGQKTGFFLDQRLNRRRVAAYAKGRRVLSAFCYTGAFEVYAAAAGAAKVIGVDRSESAVERAREHHALNGTSAQVEYLKADVGDALRKFRDMGETFDLVVLDPPRFVANFAQKEKGLRAYKDINLLAMKLLAPGGILATFSCSGLVLMEDFKMVMGWASSDADRAVRIIESLGQPPDHPVLSAFPESEYLKGLICWVE